MSLNSIPKGDVVSYTSAIEYEKNIPQMIESVNFIMTNLNSLESLIGDTPSLLCMKTMCIMLNLWSTYLN